MMRMTQSWALVILIVLCIPRSHAADTQNGAKLYEKFCVTCHGPNGKGNFAGTPDFSRSNVLLRPDGALFTSIKAGRGAMPGFLGILRDRDLFDVIAHLRTLN